ncbi:MAG: mandelate racemase/muconate lactonizing enzyme family protein [Anaerolineae bacterium]|nr:mandelate racemase/muconate lactonizing enzyme family protein [Phycisphaerae bacterium]
MSLVFGWWFVPSASHAGAITITDVRLIDYRIERTKKFVTAKGSSDACSGIFILIQAKSDTGQTWTGLGDALPRSMVTNETAKDAWAGAVAMRKALLNLRLETPRTLEEDVSTIRVWGGQLQQIANSQKLTTKRPPPAGKQLMATLCGFDEALVDLVAQIHDVPAYQVLGGAKRERVQVSALTFNADETADSLAEKVDDADESLAAMRIKIGLDDEADIKRIVAVARELRKNNRADQQIWVDVNQAWKTPEKSIEMLGRIRDALKAEAFASTFICEQPTIETDMPALAAVTKEIRIWNSGLPFKIITVADEAVWTLDDAKKMVELDAADVLNIKIQKAGGLLPSMDIANYLQKASPNTGVYIGGVVCTDITSWANLQLCFALPRLDYATGCVPRRAYPVNLATVPVQYEKDSKDKTLVSPSKPGLGTALDMSKLEKYIRHDSAKPTTQSSD